MDIGLELNLEKSDLDALQVRHKEDINDCFTDMFDLWLKTNPRPTLAELIAALRQRTVGLQQLADKLEKEGLKQDKSIKHRSEMAYTTQTTVNSCQACNTKLTCPKCSRLRRIKKILCYAPMIVVVIGITIGVYSSSKHIHNNYISYGLLCKRQRTRSG